MAREIDQAVIFTAYTEPLQVLWWNSYGRIKAIHVRNPALGIVSSLQS